MDVTGPDYKIHVGRDKATIEPMHQHALEWLVIVCIVDPETHLCMISSEFVDDLEKKLQDEGWVVEVLTR